MVSSGTATVELPTDDRIVITREFDAPRHLVYRAFTEPELVSRWWTAKRGQMKVAEIDLRVGGKWRYAAVTSEGFEVAFHGEYREIVPNERLVSTEIYEIPNQGDSPPTVNTSTFVEVDGRTTVTIVVQCESREQRDIIIESGMETGMQDALDLLEEVAVSLD